MILAAGRGERMRPLTDHCPKPMLFAGGKPLIVWHIERLVRAGLREIVINHAHLGHMLEERLGDGSEWGASIRFSPEDEALETAGGIATALPLLGDSPFLVVNGDVYCEMDFATFCARAIARITQGRMAHLALVDNPPHHPEGDFVLDASGLILRDGGARFTFSGVGVYRPELFAGLEAGVKAKLAPLLFSAIDAGRLSGEHFQGRWEDVGTPQRLAALDDELKTRS
ncbi:N-acetylmuramate alpha-1-phosphate uridylyltransferase MurU [Uliginosibacterium paludis]|uniref:N-acetylmuramate alpha-1-phosphate uridylyltransferase MurU n=1 Tax=Uliginosibacterium paludis TaxID=1615952 RepID=A0ABV2CM22_9RHOO